MSTSRDNENYVVGSGPADMAGVEAGEEYWTPERRAAAIPVPLPRERKAARPRQSIAPQPSGKAGHTAAGHNGTARAHRDSGRGGTSDADPVLNPLAYPYTTCGKLFFTQDNSNFAGSAAFVAPNVLLTAGHCVFGNGNWSTNLAFFPSYPSRATSDPAYSFNYNSAAAWTAWTQNGDRAFDYGMIWFDSAPGNQVGWLGLLWNAATAGRVWDAVGYPATPSPPFDGNKMDEALGTVQSSSTTGTIGLSNDNMEHGSSGGPWITDFNGSARQYANGLQSFHINDGDTVEYGPYFTQDVKGLLDWISDPANRSLVRA